MTDIDPEILSMIASGGYRLMPAKDVDEALKCLRDIHTELEDEADVDDGIPNDAMRLLATVQQAICWIKYGRPYE